MGAEPIPGRIILRPRQCYVWPDVRDAQSLEVCNGIRSYACRRRGHAQGQPRAVRLGRAWQEGPRGGLPRHGRRIRRDLPRHRARRRLHGGGHRGHLLLRGGAIGKAVPPGLQRGRGAQAQAGQEEEGLRQERLRRCGEGREGRRREQRRLHSQVARRLVRGRTAAPLRPHGIATPFWANSRGTIQPLETRPGSCSRASNASSRCCTTAHTS